MSQMVHMITRAIEAYENADPLTRRVTFWIFVVLLALSFAEQFSL